MQIFSTLTEITNFYQKTNLKIALVPTMGGLHQGHLSLIDIAKKNADIVIVSIFVNPTQFGAGEDFTNYPRDIDNDIKLLKNSGVDILFTPEVNEIYPNNFKFDYKVGEIANILCGKSRPTHFAGVVQVVYRLFDIIKPDIAIFGKKDYQQLTIIKQMVKDLKLGIDILNGEIIRDEFGLALSTRNKYLSDNELEIARKLNKIISSGDKIEKIRLNLEKYFNLDYCEILDAKNLGKITNKTTKFIILVAVYLGTTRLIDNFTFNKTPDK